MLAAPLLANEEEETDTENTRQHLPLINVEISIDLILINQFVLYFQKKIPWILNFFNNIGLFRRNVCINFRKTRQ